MKSVFIALYVLTNCYDKRNQIFLHTYFVLPDFYYKLIAKVNCENESWIRVDVYVLLNILETNKYYVHVSWRTYNVHYLLIHTGLS